MRLKTRLRLFNYYFLKRAFAYILDLIFIEILSQTICTVLTISLTRLIGYRFELTYEYSEIATRIQFIITHVSYFFFSYYLYDGQTLGLKTFNLQVKQNGFNNHRLKLSSCLNRAIANFVLFELYLIPNIILLANSKNKTMPDYLSDSVISYHSSKPSKISQEVKVIKTAA